MATGIITDNIVSFDAEPIVVLRGGGIFTSNKVDSVGNRIYNAAITGGGINATLINTGTLNAENINIYSGKNQRFKWYGDGLFAYGQTNTQETDFSQYIKFNEDGLLFHKEVANNPVDKVELNWDGFILRNDANDKVFYFDDNGNLTMTGHISANSGTIGGWEVNSSSIYSNNGDYGIVLDSNGSISTLNYASGQLGSGWSIASNGSAVFENIEARGKIKSAVFEYNQVSAIGGSMYVAPAIVTSSLSNAFYINGTKLSVQIPVIFDSGSTLAGHEWTINDDVVLQGLLNDDTELTQIDGIISGVDIVNSRITIDVAANSHYVGKRIAMGASIIYRGNSGLRRGIYLSADELNSPYIDVYDDVGTTSMPKTRLGNLAGIRDTSFGLGYLNGYGLYSENAYLKGKIVANDGGEIAGWSISNNKLDKTVNGTSVVGMSSNMSVGAKTFWATDNFIVYNNGSMYAKSGEFGGALNAATGSFSGTLTANNGVIGGWSIANNSLMSYNGSVGLNNAAAGTDISIWAGSNNPSSAPLQIYGNGSLIATKGNFTGYVKTEAGYIGGWKINPNSLTSYNSFIGLSNIATDDEVAVWAGSSTKTNAPFRIYGNGSIYANNGSFNGSITTNSGTICGWTMNQSTLTSGGSGLSSSLNEGDYTIWTGMTTNPNDAKFKVRNDGLVQCEEIFINGSVGSFKANASSMGFYNSSNMFVAGIVNNSFVIPDLIIGAGNLGGDIQNSIHKIESDAANAAALANAAQNSANNASGIANNAMNYAGSAYSYASSVNSALVNLCMDNNVTYINGAKIYTGSINADSINVSTLSFDRIRNSIDGTHYAVVSTEGRLTDQGLPITDLNLCFEENGILYKDNSIKMTCSPDGGSLTSSSGLSLNVDENNYIDIGPGYMTICSSSIETLGIIFGGKVDCFSSNTSIGSNFAYKLFDGLFEISATAPTSTTKPIWLKPI